MHKKFWLIALGILMLALLAGCAGGTPQVIEKVETVEVEKIVTKEVEKIVTVEVETNAQAKVYFLLPNSTTIRFTERDAPLFIQKLAEIAPNAEVIVQNGEGDPAKQQQLAEDAITQGADLIVLTASDSNLASGILNAAADADVPVILYDHDAKGGPAAAHIVFDSLAVGQAQGSRAAELIEGLGKDVVKVGRIKGNQGEYGTGQYEKGQNEFLQPLIDSGKVEVVCEQFTPNWDPTLAQSFAEDCLTQNPDIDMFIGMNDGTTGGAVAALISQGYNKGDVIVTGGQDANVEALQFIVQGWQDNSVFKNLALEAEGAAKVAASILGGHGVPPVLINGAVNNDVMDVPAVFLPVSNITIDNVGDVVKAGVWTWEQICQGAEETDVCQAALGGGGAASAATPDKAAKVFFLLPNSTTIRFTERDAPLFIEALGKLAPNAEVIVQNGEGDPAKQQQLAEDAITQGADLIVLTSSDANLASGILNAAADADVPVILYDHDAKGGPAAAHIVFDSLAVGEAQGSRAAELIEGLGQDVVKVGRIKGNQGEFGTGQYELGQNNYLQPLIDAGKVEVVCEQFTPNWDPTLAQSFAEDCLTQNPDIDMFIGMNDGTTGGAVAALISQGYNKGDVIVTGGQDANVEALQFIVQGWQDNSVFKNLALEAEGAAKVAASILGGAGVPAALINGKVNNDFTDVPAHFLPVSNITIDNVGDVVEAGVWTWAQICQGAEETDVCQAALSGAAPNAEATGTDAAGKVFFLLPNSTTIRFTERDAPLFIEALSKLAPNAEVIVQNGEGDPAKQQQLAEDAITQGAALIVLTSSDANLASGILNAAADADVPVILYDHDAKGGPAAAHIVFDSLAVGEAQGSRAAELIEGLAQDVVKVGRIKGNQGEFGTGQYELGQNNYLQPLIDSGKVEVVCEQFTPNWDPTLAQSFAEDCLTQNPDIDMFIGMNDGTTGGAVAALISQGYNKGDVIVTGGQDANVEALQFIVQGWQDNSVFKNLALEAEGAAKVAASILGGAGVPAALINGKVNNDFTDVPAHFLPVSNITIDNVGDVVEAGVWTWEQICQGAEDTDVCQANLQ